VEAVKQMPEFEAFTSERRDNEFIDLLQSQTYVSGGVNHPVISNKEQRLLKLRPSFTHISVRPREESYDKIYYAQNLQSYIHEPWRPGQPKHELYACTIQEFEGKVAQTNLSSELPRTRTGGVKCEHDNLIMYELTDVHYYLSGFGFKHTGPNCFVSTVGANFFPIPGTYRLPGCNGMYRTGKEGNITMWPRGSGEGYMHAHTFFNQPTFVISLGWYSPFSDLRSTVDWKVESITTFGY